MRKITSTKTTGIDLEKPAASKEKTTIVMKTVAARHPTKSSSKKSCKDKSITGMESSLTRRTDGGEIHSYHEKSPPNQKACPTRTKKKDSLVIAKKKDRNECNERNDKVREMLCLMCGTISDKNAQLTMKCSLKRKIRRYEIKKNTCCTYSPIDCSRFTHLLINDQPLLLMQRGGLLTTTTRSARR